DVNLVNGFALSYQKVEQFARLQKLATTLVMILLQKPGNGLAKIGRERQRFPCRSLQKGKSLSRQRGSTIGSQQIGWDLRLNLLQEFLSLVVHLLECALPDVICKIDA